MRIQVKLIEMNWLQDIVKIEGNEQEIELLGYLEGFTKLKFNLSFE